MEEGWEKGTLALLLVPPCCPSIPPMDQAVWAPGQNPAWLCGTGFVSNCFPTPVESLKPPSGLGSQVGDLRRLQRLGISTGKLVGGSCMALSPGGRTLSSLTELATHFLVLSRAPQSEGSRDPLQSTACGTAENGIGIESGNQGLPRPGTSTWVDSKGKGDGEKG